MSIFVGTRDILLADDAVAVVVIVWAERQPLDADIGVARIILVVAVVVLVDAADVVATGLLTSDDTGDEGGDVFMSSSGGVVALADFGWVVAPFSAELLAS